jgi:hypothetical protein
MHLHQIHQLGPITLDLLTGTHGAKGDFGKSHLGIGSVADASDDFFVSVFLGRIVAEQREGFVSSVEDEAGDVFFGHFGELLGKEGFETDKTDERGALVVVGYYDFGDGVVFGGWGFERSVCGGLWGFIFVVGIGAFVGRGFVGLGIELMVIDLIVDGG